MRRISKKHKSKRRKNIKKKPSSAPKSNAKGLSSLFGRRAGYLTAAAVGLGIGALVASSGDDTFIEAESDSRILAACPEIQKTEIVTITETHVPLPENAQYREAIAGYIAPIENNNSFTAAFHSYRIFQISAIPKNRSIGYDVNSMGGAMQVALPYVESMQRSKATITTNVDYVAASAASLILFAGTKGYRWANANAQILMHAVRFQKPLDPLSIKFEEDYPADSSERTYLEEANNQFRQKYIELSAIELSISCMEAIIRGKNDVIISPEFALRAGWVDAVKNMHWWTGKYNGTITVRANDPRTRQQTAPEMNASLN